MDIPMHRFPFPAWVPSTAEVTASAAFSIAPFRYSTESLTGRQGQLAFL